VRRETVGCRAAHVRSTLVQIIRRSSTSHKPIGQFFADHLSFPFLQYKEHLHVARAERQFIYDRAGKRYLDFFAGIVTVGIGHCHPRLIAAATKQMNAYWHLSTYYLQDTVRDYAEKLLEQFQDDPHLSVGDDSVRVTHVHAFVPSRVQVCLFVNSGSEANDLALHLAKEYTKQHEVISLR
jgi:alanine-glyoxylate transaminase / (R)-3-amino-2-methylpropionate-pyruvate transaminase